MEGAKTGKRRPNGDGMIRKRSDGRWKDRIVAGRKNDGKPIYKYVLAQTQSELMAKLHAKIEEYKHVGLTEECSMTVSKSLEKCGTIIGETKTEKSKRKILLPLSVVQVLRKRKEDAKSEWIFPSVISHKYALSPGAAYRKLKQILER